MLKLLGIATPGWFSTAIGILSIMLIQVAGFSLIALLLMRINKGRELDKRKPKNFSSYLRSKCLKEKKALI